jgi:hypothetical protein
MKAFRKWAKATLGLDSKAYKMEYTAEDGDNMPVEDDEDLRDFYAVGWNFLAAPRGLLILNRSSCVLRNQRGTCSSVD